MIGDFKPYQSKQTGNEYPLRCYNYIYVNGFYVPCGKCEFCLRTRAQEWAFRMEEEGRFKYTYNCLLTYDDAHLPMHKGQPSVNKVHVQLFLKRFRYYCEKYFGTKITFFLCAEYGGRKHRPHYHMVVFSDKPLTENKADPFEKINGMLAYAWSYGMSDIDNLADIGGSIGYLVNYLTSTDDGREYDKHNKPFLLMSRNGIGKSWIENHPNQVRKMREEMDYTTVINGHKHPLPRYIRRKIMPEEQQIANSDLYAEYCRNIRENYVFMNKFQKKDYETKRKNDKEYQKQRERDNYRIRKVHNTFRKGTLSANNSHTPQLSRRVDAAEKFEALTRTSCKDN